MPEVSLLATLTGTVVGFVLGGLWYGPLFGTAWMAAQGWSSETIEAMKRSFDPVRVYGGNFALGLVACFAFGWLVGPRPLLGHAVAAGVAVGAGCIAASLAASSLWEGKNFRLILINGGYQAVRFVLVGLAFGVIG
jgi:hypothetical protein